MKDLRRIGSAFVLALGLVALASCGPAQPSRTAVTDASWSMTDAADPTLAGVAVDAASGHGRVVVVGYAGPMLKLWVAEEPARDWSVVPAAEIERPDQSVAFLSIVAGPPGFLVIGDSQAVSPSPITAWFSVDGLRWEAVDSPAFKAPKNLYLAAAIWTGDRFVAVGTAPKDPDRGLADALVLSSPDGRHWVRNADPALTSDSGLHMNAIGLDGSSIVAVGHINFEGTQTLVSLDGGTTWSSAKPKALRNVTVRAVADSPAGLLFGGCTDGVDDRTGQFRAAVWVAPDGPTGVINKTSLVDQGPSSCVLDISATRSGYSAVGYVGDQAAIWSSGDGAHWQRSRVAGLDDMKDAQLTSVISGPRGEVAVGAGTRSWQSGPRPDASSIIVVRPPTATAPP